MAECGGCWTRSICVFILIGIIFTDGINANQVLLLDTTKESGALNWTTKILKPDPPDPSNKGIANLTHDPNFKRPRRRRLLKTLWEKKKMLWNEVTTYVTAISKDEPIRIYTSCYVSSREVNNWLRTPFIDVLDAKSLHIEMTFTMRKCVQHSDPTTLQQCRETFNLYMYEADRDFANTEMPSWNENTYTIVDKIPAKYLGESASDVILNTETRFVSLTKNLKGIYFAFQDTGSCLSLVAIKIYYVTCPNITINYAVFPETATGKDHTSSVQQTGTCVPNSSEHSQPIYRCMSDGSWDIALGGCHCHPGYEGQDERSCIACQKGHYKWQAGPNICRQCPTNSFTDVTGSIECRCLNNYYRADIDPKDMACTKPPSAPYQVQVVSLTDTMVQLDWQAPLDNGGRTDTTYIIGCDSCADQVMASPKWQGFNSTNTQLSELKPSTKYLVQVCSMNGVTSTSKSDPKCSPITFTTESSLAQILRIDVTDVGESHITIAWEVADADEILWYEVVHSIKDQSDTEVVNQTKSQFMTFTNLKKKTEYEFKVRGNTSKGYGRYSETISEVTGKPYDTKSEIETGPSVVIIVGAIIAVMLCMLIAGIMIFILLRRSRRNDGKNPDIDGPYHHVTVPLFTPSGTIKSYVDPHTYEDPQQAVREFTREIDASHITIESVIGGGEFGDVCKGKLRIPSRPEMTVAIKTLKPGATDKNRLDFLTEASIMGQFDSPNVIFLEGVVTKSNPIMIVTEYMANGSLDAFLRNNDGQLTVIQLVGMMRGIASGMKYLSEMGYVHRDLAARNILCTESLVCKVADFGLSREVDIDTTDGAYTTKGGKIPVRWTAPEAIAFRKFTSASDVWSFGVVMWEVISYGERPYWNWSNQDVMKAVEKGYRLPPPMECPEAIHQLMLDTWQKERNQRPKFTMIVKSLDKLIRAPELLRKMAKPRPHVFIDNTPPDINNFASVEEWLNVIKMERYRDNFATAGITSMDQVMRLTVKDLDTLGVTLLGHQKKIINSVQTLRAQLLVPQVHLPHMQVSEGFLV